MSAVDCFSVRAALVETVMELKDFISDALNRPSDCIAYYVSRRLAESFPDRSIIEGDARGFDVQGFARAKLCASVEDDRVHNRVTTEWRGLKTGLKQNAENAWLNIWWEHKLLDVLLLSWNDGSANQRHFWIIAESEQTGQEFLKTVCEWSSEVRGEILVYDNGYWSKSEELFEAIRGASFEDIVLPSELKGELQEDFRRFFDSRDLYQRYKLPWRRGVLFVGPPGNGKTQAVKALINQLGHPCLYVKSFESYWDTDQENMREVFARARRMTTCVVVLEDLDSLINDKSRSFFLNELDGFAPNTGVVVVGTTNHPERLDPAILDRPSRFDRKYHFPLPSAQGRLVYLIRWRDSLQTELRCSDRALERTVRSTEGFSFAYLKELCVSAMTAWMAENSRQMDDVLHRTAELLRNQMDGNRKPVKKKKAKQKKARAAAGSCDLWS
jgi:AAA+ superfamily predicted ATPase